MEISFTRLWAWIKSLALRLHAWLGPDVAAVFGRLNKAELRKAIVLGLGSGSLVQLAQVIANSATMIDPVDAEMISTSIAIITAIIDMARRMCQGRPS